MSSAEKLARAMGAHGIEISTSAVQQAESGNTYPRDEHMVAMRRAMGLGREAAADDFPEALLAEARLALSEGRFGENLAAAVSALKRYDPAEEVERELLSATRPSPAPSERTGSGARTRRKGGRAQ